MMFRGVCIFMLLALSASAQEAESKLSRVDIIKQKCVDEIKFTDMPISNLTASMINNPKTKCLVACIWREMGAVNEDNSFNATLWVQQTPSIAGDTELIQAVNECSREKDPNLCETAYKFHMCLINKNNM